MLFIFPKRTFKIRKSLKIKYLRNIRKGVGGKSPKLSWGANTQIFSKKNFFKRKKIILRCCCILLYMSENALYFIRVVFSLCLWVVVRVVSRKRLKTAYFVFLVKII